MFVSVLLTTVLGASSALAASVNATVGRPRICGSVPSDEKLAANEAHFAANRVEAASGLVANANFEIPVIWHVIKSSSTTGTVS